MAKLNKVFFIVIIIALLLLFQSCGASNDETIMEQEPHDQSNTLDNDIENNQIPATPTTIPIPTSTPTRGIDANTVIKESNMDYHLETEKYYFSQN